MPNLPALPAPASYPKLAPPVKGPDVEGCGQVWSGAEWVPMSCLAPRLGPHRAAEVVIPYERMRPAIDQLPRVVDHRAEGTEGPTRKQRGPECTAFAFTSALDHAYTRWAGSPGNFSVMQVWARYYNKHEEQAALSNVGDVISSELAWPYDGKTANSWKACKGGENANHPCGQPVDQAKLAEADRNAMAVITKVEVVPTSELDVLREKIAAGQDVVVSLKLPSFATAGSPGAKYIVGTPSTDPAKSGKVERHEVLLSGYAMTPNGNYYLVHNSFGDTWGDNGYAWLHEDIFRSSWLDKIVVIPYLEPLQVAKLRPNAQGGLSRACDGDQVPDSIAGLCAPRCPDGSPRHNDVCARAGECLRGQVNLTGQCMLAAPTSSGTDPASGVSWACGPGGCAYSMPKGALGCTERVCAVSCPAPDFRLGTTPQGFVCID
jgi:hypothetical protein